MIPLIPTRFIYLAQHRDHRSDLMYSALFTNFEDMVDWLGANADNYIIWRFVAGDQPLTKVISLK